MRFTFHHVSIKTVPFPNDFFKAETFTFHHVSIKTLRPLYNSQRPPAFTFHHVSIKTMYSRMELTAWVTNSHSTMYLLKHI